MERPVKPATVRGVSRARRTTGGASAPMRRIAFVLGALAAVVACSSSKNEVTRAALAAGCVLNSDCASPFVCAFKTCHVQCTSSRDCLPQPGGRCVESDKPVDVCLNPQETSCVRNSDCPGTEVCGVDLQCRDACIVSRDCLTDQSCIAGTCVDPVDLVDGGLPVADGGTTSLPCIHASDCPGTLVCVQGSCGVQCESAKDCPLDWSCADALCVPPGSSDAAAGNVDASGDASSDAR